MVVDSKKVQKTNGEVNSAVITKTEVIKEATPKIIVKGKWSKRKRKVYLE